MGQLALSEEIAAPPEAVFAVASDLPRAADHISGIDKIEMLTDGPVGEGTRWRETRTMFGRSATEELTVTSFDPPRGYTVKSDSCGAVFVCRFGFEPSDAGTRVTLEVDWRSVSLFAKVMAPLGRLMMGSAMNAMRQDLRDLKQVVESRQR